MDWPGERNKEAPERIQTKTFRREEKQGQEQEV
jgi:hypothetical protein